MLLGLLIIAGYYILIALGCIMFVVGLILFLIEKSKNEAIQKGLLIMLTGASIAIGTVLFSKSVVVASDLKKQYEYNNIPNRIDLSDSDAQSFQIDGENYVCIDFLNNYIYESFTDTEYNVALDLDNHRVLKVSKYGAIKIYSAYGNLYVNEKDEPDIWDTYKDYYKAEYCCCSSENKKKPITINDMDLYLEIWREYKSKQQESYQSPVDYEMEYFQIDCESYDRISNMTVEIGRDASNHYYYVYKGCLFAVPIENISFQSFFEGLHLE